MSQAAVQLWRDGVASFAPYVTADGELRDPVWGAPTQYGTAYHAYCQAVLARVQQGSPAGERAAARAACGLAAAARHVGDPTEPPTLASFHRDTGQAGRGNHRDFFWPPLLRGWRILADLGHPDAPALAAQIARVPILRSFSSRPPSNWAAVWLSGEWRRMRAELSPTSPDAFDAWLAAFFQSGRILLDRGFYQEPGHPNSYDLFTRYHLADILAAGYAGVWQPELWRLLETGLGRSLAVQLSDGGLASAHRSTGQTWTLGCQVAYFMTASRLLADRDPAASGRARTAAALAASAMARARRADGPFSPVENTLPPAWRVGYEPYTADAHYGTLALAFLGAARPWDLPPPESDGRPATTFCEGDPVHRALCHHGRYSVHLNGFPAPDYDAFGIVDLTVGPGRLLQFASSVRQAAGGALWNLGLALRDGPDRAAIRPVCQAALALARPIAPGEAPASLRLEARPRGADHLYRLAVRVTPGGVDVEEATPGRHGPLTLMVPYLRDAGSGRQTTVRVGRAAGGGTRVELGLGEERVALDVEAELAWSLDLPHGAENRRGVCGLLRLDLAGERALLRYRVHVVA